MPPFAAEAPITQDDEDALSRGNFADELASLLSGWTGDHSLVVALRGTWGEGKTSLKNLIVRRLEKLSPKPGPLEFNPWRYENSAAISAAFYREVAIALRERGSSIGDLKRAHWFGLYGKLLGPAADGLRVASGTLGDILGWLVSAGLLAAGAGALLFGLPIATITGLVAAAAGSLGLIGKIIGAVGQAGLGKPIELVRHDLRIQLRKRKSPLIVIIDDIDRLDQDEIRTVFRHVKANADLPNLTYLLMFQRDIVERALNDASNNQGRAYLAKIVQASFDLPAADRASIVDVFFKGLVRVFDGHADEASGFHPVRWGNVFHGGVKFYLANLRDVHRLISSLTVHLELHRGKRVLEVNAVDFIAIETLRLFDPEVFAALSAHKKMLTGVSADLRGLENERTSKTVKAIVELVPEERREQVEDIINRLFPTIRWVFNNTHYGADHIAGWSEARRICTERYFDRYFSLRLAQDDISDSEMLDIFDDASSVDRTRARIDDLADRGLLKTLFFRLDEKRGLLPLDNFHILGPALMSAADRLKEDDSFGVEAAAVSAWRSLLWYLRQETDQTRRGELFLQALRDTDGLSAAATIISIDLDKRSKESESNRFMTDAQLEVAQSIWLDKLRRRWMNLNDALADHRFRGYLYRWSEYAPDGDTDVKAFVSGLVHKPDTLIPLLHRFQRMSRSQTMGDLVSRTDRTLDLQALEPFIDIVEVREAAKTIDLEGLDDADRALINEVLNPSSEQEDF